MRLFSHHYARRSEHRVLGADVLSEVAQEILKNYHNVNCDEGKIG